MTTAQLDNSTLDNPYAAPLSAAESANHQTAKTPIAKPMSIAIGIAGAFMLFIGWAASIMAVIDLYCPSAPILSEITGMALNTTSLWLIYGLTVAVTTLGALMFCSRPLPGALMGAFIMCPILLIAYMAGTPLRLAKQWAMPAAAIYLAIGTCCAAFAGSRMHSLFAVRHTDAGFDAVLFHPLLLIGAACIAGAIAKITTIQSGDLTPDRFQTE